MQTQSATNSPRESPRASATETRGVSSGDSQTEKLQESASHHFQQASYRLGEIREYAAFLVSAKADALKLTVRNILVYAVLGVIALLAAVSAVAVSVTLLLVGAAHGIGAALGDRDWAGDLIVSVLVLAAIAVGTMIGISILTKSSRRKTVDKYESRKRDQRTQFGYDVTERAGQ